jgi:hypothetical protein
MQGSNLIYIVMPVVIVLALVVLIALPFAGTRQQSQGQVPGRPVARDAFGSEVTGLGHQQHAVTTHAHDASGETTGSGGTGSNANASRVTSRSAGEKSSRS